MNHDLGSVCTDHECLHICVSSRYNNQWMIVDYNYFTPGKTDIKENLFVVLEQIPYVCALNLKLVYEIISFSTIEIIFLLSFNAAGDTLFTMIKLRNCWRMDTGPVTTYRKYPVNLAYAGDNMCSNCLINKMWSFICRYYEEIFNASGCNELVQKYGPWFSLDQNPRAQIFKRNQTAVTDVDSMVRLMR